MYGYQWACLIYIIATISFYVSVMNESGHMMALPALLRVLKISQQDLDGISFYKIVHSVQQKGPLYVWDSSNWCVCSPNKSMSQRRSSVSLYTHPKTPIGLSWLSSCSLVMWS